MKPFQIAEVSFDEVEKGIQEAFLKWKEGNETMRKLIPAVSEADALAHISKVFRNEQSECTVYMNDKYQVHARVMRSESGETPPMVHLSIKRLDRAPIHDWRDLQEIKTQLVGAECEGVELYPAESRVIDTANQYHLWCFTVPEMRFPIGFNEGRCVVGSAFGKAVQRPLEKESA